MSGPGGGNGFFTVTTEGPTLTSAAGISIQPWKCPFSLLTCGMNVLPTKPPNCWCLLPYQSPYQTHAIWILWAGLVNRLANFTNVKDCDNICWHLTTIFASLAHQCLPKFVDNICQSSICLSCSPIRGRQSYFVWRPTDPRTQASNRSICALFQLKTILWWNDKFTNLLSIQRKESFEDFSATYLFVCGKSVYGRCSQKIFQRHFVESISFDPKLLKKIWFLEMMTSRECMGGKYLCLIDFSAFRLGRFGGKSGRGDEWLRGARAG